MITDKSIVLGIIDSLPKGRGRVFVPLGAEDRSTKMLAELSDRTIQLYKNIPLVKSITEACREYPVYVGYSGVDGETGGATYTSNLVLMHNITKESPMQFAADYPHELVHLDQDRRGLLMGAKDSPSPSQMGDYVVHTLFLEAAGFATEMVCLYHLSNHSALKDDPEVEDYYGQHIENIGDYVAHAQIEESLKGIKIRKFEDLKPAWQALFQHFFHPDSARVTHYVEDSCKTYFHVLSENCARGQRPQRKIWGSMDQLAAVTTLPGWGPMFDRAALPVLLRQIHASTFQDKHMQIIDLTRDHAQAIVKNMKGRPGPEIRLP